MKLCRFDRDKLGVVEEGVVFDVSAVLDRLPVSRWVRSLEDPVVSRLDALRPEIEKCMATAPKFAAEYVTMEAPVANPSKIIGAPVNYHSHVDEARADRGLNQGRTVHPIDEIGCFLKAGSALAGHGSVLTLPIDGARVDHEAEVAVIVGKIALNVKADDALSYVAGYSLALDMTVRGKQDRSMRKSCDGFAVLGPTLVTADEIEDHTRIGFDLRVNGELRQSADTRSLIRSIPELIEMCSRFYTLYPGDVIMTGTPAGVAPVVSGDRVDVESQVLGTLSITVQ